MLKKRGESVVSLGRFVGSKATSRADREKAVAEGFEELGDAWVICLIVIHT